MANIRASAAVTTILVATASAVSIGIATAGGVTATAQPTPVIRASAFAVPMSVLENQTVLMSDFRFFDIGQVTIDVATVTDDVAISFNTSFSDTVTATDVINKTFYGNVDYDPTDPDADPDPITVADTINTKGVGKVLTDAATMADTVAKTPGKVTTDSVTSAEAINTKHVGKPSTDAVTAADAVNTINTAKVVIDSATIADALAKELTRPNVADSVTTADTSLRSPGLGKTDSVTGSDAINTFALNKSPSDSVTGTDTINKFDVTTALTDSVTVTEFIAKTPAYQFDYDTVDADADPDPVTVTEVMAKDLTRPNITDSSTIADAVSLQPSLPKTDSVTMADTLAKDFTSPETDSVTMADATAKSVDKPFTDALAAATDAIVFTQNKSPSDSVTASDAISAFSVSKALTDTATMADSINVVLTLGQSSPLYDFAATSDDKFYYAWTPGMLNRHLIHQPLVNGEFVLTTDQNAGIVYTIRTESYSYMFAGYGLNENQLN